MRIGSITGVHVLDVEVERLHAGLQVVARVHGRSPSLNAADSVWCGIVADGNDAAGQTASLFEAFAPHIALQEERARAGMELGAPAPYGVGNIDDASDRTKVGHILVDRGLAALLDGDDGDLLGEVRDSVWVLHQDNAGEHDDGLAPEYAGATTDDDGHEEGEHMLVGRMLVRDVPLGDGLVYDGRELKAATPLPDTVLLSIAGRTLGEVVEVPALLAGLRIVGARSTDEGVALRIEPDLATVDDLIGGDPGDS